MFTRSDSGLTRRRFLQTTTGAAVAVGLESSLTAGQPKKLPTQKPYEIRGPNGMRLRLFGRTGRYISVIAGNETFPTPVADKAIALGINYWHKTLDAACPNGIRIGENMHKLQGLMA